MKINNINIMVLKIILSAAIAAGVIYGVYKLQKDNLKKNLEPCDNFDVDFVTKWIASQDQESYNSSYTAVMMRGQELPNAQLWKMFFNIDDIVCLAIFDSANKTVVKTSYFKPSRIADELSKDKFIEFPYEM